MSMEFFQSNYNPTTGTSVQFSDQLSTTTYPWYWWNTYPPSHPPKCPNCGYCGCCGRADEEKDPKKGE